MVWWETKNTTVRSASKFKSMIRPLVRQQRRLLKDEHMYRTILENVVKFPCLAESRDCNRIETQTKRSPTGSLPSFCHDLSLDLLLSQRHLLQVRWYFCQYRYTMGLLHVLWMCGCKTHAQPQSPLQACLGPCSGDELAFHHGNHNRVALYFHLEYPGDGIRSMAGILNQDDATRVINRPNLVRPSKIRHGMSLEPPRSQPVVVRTRSGGRCIHHVVHQ